MINQIFIDTNIYRQLGLSFDSHIDFVNLKRYFYGSGSEIRLSEVVLNELLDYYTNDIIDSNLKGIQKSINKLKSISHDEINDYVFSEDKRNELIKSIRQRILNGTLYAKNDFVSEKELIDFLIFNKQTSKKDNTRDFLIFLSAIKIALEYPEDQMVIISNDNIFSTNNYFKKLLTEYEIKNIKTVSSIASFLAEYSQKLDFVSPETLVSLISKSEIKAQIENDIDSIPSHISKFYYSTRRNFNVELFEVENIKVTEFYSYKDLDTDELRILFHVIPKVNIIFEPEKDINALRNYLLEISNKPKYNLETFDEELRPIYNTELMFIYTVAVNKETKEFKDIEFIDFFPDHYHIKTNYHP